MKTGNKIIKTLEGIAIILLIICFIILVYSVYTSIIAEKEFESNYKAETIASNSQINNEKNISEIINEVNRSVVGISKIKDKGNTIFLKDSVKNLGLGTGFAVSEDGYIVTNYHVSGEKNSTCYVTLEDGRNFTAKVVWADEDLDLSIIKINVKNLRYLELGDSEKINIAQEVYAVGNPIGFEFQRTVTKGIISGLNRTIKLEEKDKTYYMEDLIQTDATINPGNSGGPLIDKEGNVIGINSVKITSAEGIGFAVPINIIKPIINKLKVDGDFNAATLGIFAYDKNIIPYTNKELGKNQNLEKGIYIEKVIKNSPAEIAGVKEGDVLTEIDGKQINKMSELREYIYEKYPNDNVEIKFIRKNKEYKKIIKLDKK